VVKDVDKIAAENKVVRRPEIRSADIEARQLRCRPYMLSTISRSPIWISVSIGSGAILRPTNGSFTAFT
jgi:hypothetical protein